MQQRNIDELLDKYNNGDANAEERELVESWYLKFKPGLDFVPHQQLIEDQKRSLKILFKGDEFRRKEKLRWSLAIAASILLFFSISGYYLWLPKKPNTSVVLQKSKNTDFNPGGNKATLTLANGSVITLTGAKNGKLANQGSTSINKTGEGIISYASTNSDKRAAATVYNTATTPRGGQYQLVLADGTKVWLNAASSIKFPVAFPGNERRVELTGEAYFEVVHDSRKPFLVVSNGQTVEDLGTHFNINGYNDENSVKTTLLQGLIRISANGESRTLKPGEQAQLKNGGLTIANVDVDEAIAWKNGFFHFDDSSIQEVARQLSRWYDVDIRYDGQLPQRLFSGEISRNVKASQILDILSFKKIHYRIDGKSIVILP